MMAGDDDSEKKKKKKNQKKNKTKKKRFNGMRAERAVIVNSDPCTLPCTTHLLTGKQAPSKHGPYLPGAESLIKEQELEMPHPPQIDIILVVHAITHMKTGKLYRIQKITFRVIVPPFWED